MRTYEATLAVLGQAVLDLAGADAPQASRLRQRLREIGPVARDTAERARTIAGYRPPDLSRPYTSVFSLFQRGDAGQPLTIMPQSLGMCPAYPVSGSVDAEALQRSFIALREELRRDLAILPPEPNALMFLLEKHGWAVSTGLPGLAFTDLARMTAATAGALASGVQRLLLIGADISGVQKFIYTISAKGALKSLRARSFFLELIAEEAARRLLERLDLTRANLLYAGGGHLYLLAPDTAEAASALESVQAELNDWFLDQVGGQLYLAVGSAAFAPALMAPGAESVPHVWQQVSAALGRSKAGRFRAEAGQADFWKPADLKRAICDVCHQETDQPAPLGREEEEEEVPEACPLCWTLYRLGSRLPHAQYLVALATGDGDIEVAGTGYRLCYDAAEVRRIPRRLAVTAINALDAAALAVGDDTHPVWLGTYSQKTADGRTIATFAELAGQSEGKPLLGVLRMDVDGLGHLFSGGLPPDCRDFGRTAALSGALTRFFKLHLNSLCTGDGGADFEPLRMVGAPGPRPVTVVYAGGDDLFVVGSWDQTLELAFDIHSAFHRYTGGRLTVSAGMVAADYHMPIHRLAQEAGAAEKAAKRNRRGPDPGKKEKDSIAPLFAGVQQPAKEGRQVASALFWDEAIEMINGFLKPAMTPQPSPRGPECLFPRRLVYDLLRLADYWVVHGPLYLPRLAYLLAQVSEDVGTQNGWKRLRDFLLKHRYEMAHFPPFLRWLDLIGRGGAEDEHR